MTELQKFLTTTDVSELRRKIVLRRLGEKYPITIRPLTGDEHASYQKVSISISPKTNKRDFSLKKFQNLIVTNCVLDPDFKDADWIKQANVSTPEQLVNKTLLAGEVSFLAEQVLKFSGFDEDINEEVDEVKNS